MFKTFFIGEKEFKLPIIQGGMGVSISLSELASAVSNEGGIGITTCTSLPLDLSSYLLSNCNTQLFPTVYSARTSRPICEKWFSNHNYLSTNVVIEDTIASGYVDFKKECIEDKKSYTMFQRGK